MTTGNQSVQLTFLSFNVSHDSIKTRIRFHFLLFQIEDEENCSYDYVEVMEGSGGLLIGRYCGSVVSGFYFYLYAIS